MIELAARSILQITQLPPQRKHRSARAMRRHAPHAASHSTLSARADDKDIAVMGAATKRDGNAILRFREAHATPAQQSHDQREVTLLDQWPATAIFAIETRT
jgi:hypothetical protein